MAKVSVVFILIVAGLALAGYLLKFIWVGLLPVLLAILVSTVLYPISAWLRSRDSALARGGKHLARPHHHLLRRLCRHGPVVTSQSQTLIDQAEDGINQITEMVEKSPSISKVTSYSPYSRTSSSLPRAKPLPSPPALSPVSRWPAPSSWPR